MANNSISRKSSITAESLETYKDLIETAKGDLEAHLENIDGKLERILGHTVAESDSDASELRLIKEERLSTEKCLQICAQLSDHIDQLQFASNRSDSSCGPSDPDALPERITNEGLQECKNSLALTVAKLESHMQDVMNRLLTKSKRAMTSEDEFMDLTRLRDEWNTARQCMDICSKADTHLKENITSIDNYATGDAIQFMVSTNGKPLHGKNRGLGWRSRQVGGYISDVSVQQLSRDLTGIAMRNTGNESRSSPGNTAFAPDEVIGNEATSEFKERYGQGFKLTPKSSTTSAEGRRSNSQKG